MTGETFSSLHSLPGRYFGLELKLARRKVGWSQSQLSEAIGFSDALIGYVENGRRTPTPGFAEACDNALNCNGGLARLTQLVRHFGTPHAPLRRLLREAASLRAADPLFVPELAQTPDYTRALLRATHLPSDDIEAHLADRPSLKALLDTSPELRAWIVLDQTSLYRPVGGAETLRLQFKELLALIDTGRVIAQILPTAASAILLRLPVTLLSFTYGDDVAHLPNGDACDPVERYGDPRDHNRRFDLLRAAAWPPARSRGAIATAIR